MSKSDVEEAFTVLEGGGSLQLMLEAIATLEMWVSVQDQESLSRLEALSDKLEGPAGSAAERALVRIRRSSAEREVLTRSPVARAEGKLASSLLEAGKVLEGDDFAGKVSFMDRCARELVFDVAPLLANRLPKEKDPLVAAAMARTLGKLSADGCLKELKQAALRREAEVRIGAVHGMAYQAGRDVLLALISRFGDVDKQVLEVVFEVLDSIPLSQTLDVLSQIPPGALVRVKVGAVRYLKGRLQHESARKQLRAWLIEDDQRLSSEALVALAGVRDKAAVRVIEDLEGDDDPRTQKVLTLAKAALEAAPAE